MREESFTLFSFSILAFSCFLAEPFKEPLREDAELARLELAADF